MIYEIRDYTIEKRWFRKYVYWAENYFIPYAKDRIDLIDFWVYSDLDAEVSGKNPFKSPNVQPNITWVAKFENMVERNNFYENLDNNPEWDEIWNKHPNPDAYIHKNSRFFESIID